MKKGDPHQPWNVDQSEAFIPDPIFGPDSELRLSELDVPSMQEAAYEFGGVFVRLHRHGEILHDLHTGNVGLSSRTGRFVIGDPGGFSDVGLDPANMCQQFVEMYPTWKDSIMSLLGGYVRSAYQVLDPLYPGYTDRFISLISDGIVLSRPRPRAAIFDFKRLLIETGGVLLIEQDRPVVRCQTPIRPPTPVVPLEILQVVSALLLAGVDPTEWLLQSMVWASSSSLSMLLGSLAHHEHQRRELEASIEMRQWISFIRDVYSQCPKDTWTVPNYRVHRVLLQQLSNLDFPTCDIWLDVLIDGIDWLAQSADSQGQILKSIQLAQMSLFLLQRQAHQRDSIEPRSCALEARLRTLSWSDTKNLDFSKHDNLFAYCAFAISATKTERDFFTASRRLFDSGQAANLLWCSALSAINRQRELMILMQSFLLRKEASRDVAENCIVLLQAEAASYLNALKHHLDAIIATTEDRLSTWFLAWSKPEFFMRREIESVARLTEELHKAKSVNGRLLDLLESLCQVIRSTQS